MSDHTDPRAAKSALRRFYGFVRQAAGNWSAPADRARNRVAIDLDRSPVYAIGDVHGCLDLLHDLEAQIAADNATRPWIVLLGDIVDRGPQSAQVLDHVLHQQASNPRYLCLCGNHEAMMTAFLEAPKSHPEWLRNGGDATLLSYGLLADEPDQQLAERLKSYIPTDHIKFLADLPVAIETDDFIFTHAGLRPGIRLEDQDDTTLLWFRDDMRSDFAASAKLVVHGHQAGADAVIRPKRINIDTGAYATGRLTAVRLGGGLPIATFEARGPAAKFIGQHARDGQVGKERRA